MGRTLIASRVRPYSFLQSKSSTESNDQQLQETSTRNHPAAQILPDLRILQQAIHLLIPKSEILRPQLQSDEEEKIGRLESNQA